MYQNTKCKLQAHRGVSTEAPENTIAAFQMAYDQGYDIIELDPKYTKDGEIVVLHDWTLNRTGRINGKIIEEEKLDIRTLNYADLSIYNVGEWKGEQWKEEKIPTLHDALTFIRKHGMEVKVDNVLQNFPEDMQKKALHIIKEVDETIGVTASNLDYLRIVVSILPHAHIHYDGLVDEEHLNTLSSIINNNPCTIWLRYNNKLTAWNKNPPATKDYVDFAKKYGKVGLWILSTNEEMQQALEFGADVVETTGGIKP